jgi:hypothetical protein
MSESTPQKQPWLKLYSLVIIANIIYIVLFYLIMKSF